jgi:hypothetical protein
MIRVAFATGLSPSGGANFVAEVVKNCPLFVEPEGSLSGSPIPVLKRVNPFHALHSVSILILLLIGLPCGLFP